MDSVVNNEYIASPSTLCPLVYFCTHVTIALQGASQIFEFSDLQWQYVHCQSIDIISKVDHKSMNYCYLDTILPHCSQKEECLQYPFRCRNNLFDKILI